jgi:hypothetical protein
LSRADAKFFQYFFLELIPVWDDVVVSKRAGRAARSSLEEKIDLPCPVRDSQQILEP